MSYILVLAAWGTYLVMNWQAENDRTALFMLIVGGVALISLMGLGLEYRRHCFGVVIATTIVGMAAHHLHELKYFR